MGFIDAIIEGLGNTLLFFGGLIVIVIGLAVGAASASTGSNIGVIIALVIIVFGIALLASKYRRQK